MAVSFLNFARVSSITRWAVVGSLGWFLGGCEKAPSPQFTPAAKLEKLLPEVRDGWETKNDDDEILELVGVTEAVDARFGTLAEPVVWAQLPIDFGGTSSTVTAVDSNEAEQPVKTVTVSLKAAEGESLPAVRPGSQVAWTDGVYEGLSHRITAFDAATGKATLVGKFDEGLPEEGDECLLGAGERLVAGQSLYARHCMHCHGAGGAGDGPTARYLIPPPRDYRLGVFKFTSTDRASKISRDDLLRVLQHGIPGTSMPAFRLLADDDLNLLVEYVRWLSMRGEYENKLAEAAAGADMTREVLADEAAGDAEKSRQELLEDLGVRDFLEYDLADTIEFTGDDLVDAWSGANEEDAVLLPSTSRPPVTPESLERGRLLYLSDTTKCASCHGVYGKGNGPQTTALQLIPGTQETYPRPGLYDAWDNLIAPRDLTQGVYRFGRRPIDLYRRIHAGIKGTPMPGFGGTLTDEQIWDLVNYVMQVPFDPLPTAGRGKAVANAGE